MSHLQASCDATAQFSCHSHYRVCLYKNFQIRNIFLTTVSLLDTKRARRRQILTISIRFSNSTAQILRFICAGMVCVCVCDNDRHHTRSLWRLKFVATQWIHSTLVLQFCHVNSLHDIVGGVWCELSATRIYGPFFVLRS